MSGEEGCQWHQPCASQPDQAPFPRHILSQHHSPPEMSHRTTATGPRSPPSVCRASLAPPHMIARLGAPAKPTPTCLRTEYPQPVSLEARPGPVPPLRAVDATWDGIVSRERLASSFCAQSHQAASVRPPLTTRARPPDRPDAAGGACLRPRSPCELSFAPDPSRLRARILRTQGSSSRASARLRGHRPPTGT
jgi:hypothetical protein